MIEHFKELNLSEPLAKAIELMDYSKPTEVQKQVIPLILQNKDVIVKSQTGSGKTAAFVIPLCQLVDWEENPVQALILTPTRELALQIQQDVFHIGRFKRIKCVALYGRDSFIHQSKDLKQKTHIAVGTPGRVLDHIRRDSLHLEDIRYLIIDEADEMLNMGFIDDVTEIIETLPKNRVTVLLSATMSQEIVRLSQKHMRNPLEVEIDSTHSPLDVVNQSFYSSVDHDKLDLLRRVTTVENPDSCIVFCNTQVAVDEVKQFLSYHHYTCEKIHGGMEQRDRTKVMKAFRHGVFRYLIATDVAARGIDVDDISLVVNYDTPKKAESYVHRVGRTGRIGKEGVAVTFVSSRDYGLLEDIQMFIHKKCPLTAAPEDGVVKAASDAFYKKMETRPEMKENRSDALDVDIVKIHINAGKKTKMRAMDIVGTLCALENMTAADIGIINILDISTYVEILNGKGMDVLVALQSKPIKGRLRVVSQVYN